MAAGSIFSEAIALTVGALLPIMNPFATAPLFLSLTAKMDSAKRNHQALVACLYAFSILIVFLLLGSAIIDFFGISVPGIRVAGGLIVSVIGLRMLFPAPANGDAGSPRLSPVEEEIAFTPLAMPSLAGPGSISVVVTAASQIRTGYAANYVEVYAGVLVGMAITIVITWLVLRTATSLARVLGASGIDAMTRIFGFLLICIGVQFLLIGISDFFGLTVKAG
jgi:multiple antibiotic resistance protein